MSATKIKTKPNKRQVIVTSVFEQIERAIKPIVVSLGGAGSGKSYSMAQLIIMKFINEDDKMIGICRKTFPALRITAYKLVVDLLMDYGYYSRCDHNKSEHTIKYHNNMLYFFSLDDPEKVKSLDLNYLWIEEATELSWEDFLILRMRMRRKSIDGKSNQVYLTLNPIDQENWVAKMCRGLLNEAK
jgi:phage terminase large subunit